MGIKWNKIVVRIVALCVVVVITVPDNLKGYAEISNIDTYTDLKEHKYEGALLYCIEKGLMWDTASSIDPDSKLTKGDICISLNALLSADKPYDKMNEVQNLKSNNIYYKAVSIGLNCGYLLKKENGNVYNPAEYATYGYIADIFSRVLGMQETLIFGNKTKDYITRGEYANLLRKLAPNIIDTNTNTVISGDVYIRNPDITLLNVVVDGNLIIADGVADQETILRNVKVNGTVIIRGGSSIVISGNSSVPEIVVKQSNYPVTIKISNIANVGDIEVMEGSKDIMIIGKADSMMIDADSVRVSIHKATIGQVLLSNNNISLIVENNTKISNLTLKKSAKNASVEVAGEVGELLASPVDAIISIMETGKVIDIIDENE